MKKYYVIRAFCCLALLGGVAFSASVWASGQVGTKAAASLHNPILGPGEIISKPAAALSILRAEWAKKVSAYHGITIVNDDEFRGACRGGLAVIGSDCLSSAKIPLGEMHALYAELAIFLASGDKEEFEVAIGHSCVSAQTRKISNFLSQHKKSNYSSDLVKINLKKSSIEALCRTNMSEAQQRFQYLDELALDWSSLDALVVFNYVAMSVDGEENLHRHHLVRAGGEWKYLRSAFIQPTSVNGAIYPK